MDITPVRLIAMFQVALGALALVADAFAPRLELQALGRALLIVGAAIFVLLPVVN